MYSSTQRARTIEYGAMEFDELMSALGMIVVMVHASRMSAFAPEAEIKQAA